MFSKIACIVLILSLANVSIFSQARIESDVTLCPLRVPDSVKQATANFVVSYTFRLNEIGAPVNVMKVKDDHVGADEIMLCLSDWKISGFPDKATFTAVFAWKHGRGWVQLILAGPEFTQTVKLKNGIGY